MSRRHHGPDPGLLPLAMLLGIGLVWTAVARLERPLAWRSTGAAAAVAAGYDPGRRPGLRIDLNSATATELTVLPGVGPRLADRIVRNRVESGPFASAEELQRVHRIGPSLVERVAPYVLVGGHRPGEERHE